MKQLTLATVGFERYAKSRRVDLERGESFGFLGFDFRYLRGLRGVMRPHYTPKLKKRTALLVIRIADQPVPIEEVPQSGPMPHSGYRDFDTTACRLAFPDFSFVPLQHGLVKMAE
jgi:hypothetical protein